MSKPMCKECGHRSSSHALDGPCKTCGCALTWRESIEGRDEALDESVRSAIWEDAVSNGESWALERDDEE